MTVVALVLNGGRSSRMGADKSSLVQVNGNSLLDQVYTNLIEAGISSIFLLGGESQHHGMTYLVDQYPQQGPVMGLASGVNDIIHTHKLNIEGWICLPVDMPAFTHEAIRHLLFSGLTTQVPTYFEGSILPLYIPNEPNVLAPLVAMLTREASGKGPSFRTWLHGLTHRVIPCPEPYWLLNLNHPNEWQRWQQLQMETAKGV